MNTAAATAIPRAQYVKEVGLMSAGHGLTHWYPATFYVLMPVIGRELGLSYTEIASVVTSQAIAGAISNIPGGTINRLCGSGLEAIGEAARAIKAGEIDGAILALESNLEHLEHAKQFYDKFGMHTVVLARFIPVVRTFVPIIAGVVNMRYRTFLAFNVIGAITWAAGVTFLGYYLGERVPLVQEYFGPVIVVIVLATTLPLVWELRKKS